MDFSSFEPHELIVLAKALHFVKFESKEPGASAIAGSPFLGNLYAEATETLWAQVASSSKSGPAAFFIANGWPPVDNDVEKLATIKFHIAQAENWNDLSDEARRAFITDLVYPLKASGQTLNSLLATGNERHRVI